MILFWRHMGLSLALLYLVVSLTTLGIVFNDAAHVNVAALKDVLALLPFYSMNSLEVAAPAAALSLAFGYPLAKHLRARAPSNLVVPLLLLLTPFFVSALALYHGIRSIFGIGTANLVGSLAFRYFPISVIFLLLALASIPASSKTTLANLGVKNYRILFRLELPIVAWNAAIIFVYLCFAMSLDVSCNTVVGGGTIQIFGSLIFDYSRTQTLQSVSSLVSAAMALILMAALVSLVAKSPRRLSQTFERTGALGRPQETGALPYSNLILYAYLLIYGGILFALFQQSSAVNEHLDELYAGLATSAVVVGGATFATMGVSLLISSWLHLGKSLAAAQKNKLVTISLFLPLLFPPVLAGRMAAVVQGMAGVYGNFLSTGFWYLYFFGPLCVLLLLGHPLLLDVALPIVAENHRIRLTDYVQQIFIPTVTSATIVGASLFAAVAVSDSLVARYVGGSTKTLGVVLSNHQEGTLSSSDYMFLFWLGIAMLLALLLAGVWLSFIQRRIWRPDSSFAITTDETD